MQDVRFTKPRRVLQQIALPGGFTLSRVAIEVDGPRVGPEGQRATAEFLDIEHETNQQWLALGALPLEEAEQLAVALIQATPGKAGGDVGVDVSRCDRGNVDVYNGDGERVMCLDPAQAIWTALAIIRAAREK